MLFKMPSWSQTAVFLLFTTFFVILLIQLGLFDPKPVGQAQWQLELSPQTIPAHSRQLTWLNYPLPTADYSVQLTAVHQSGEIDTGYGLILGDNSNHLAIEVSPLGYVAVSREQSATLSTILPWQPWPHIRPDSNEIWLNVQNGRFTVRINGEWLWEEEVAGLEGKVGWIGESFGETAVIQLTFTGFSVIGSQWLMVK